MNSPSAPARVPPTTRARGATALALRVWDGRAPLLSAALLPAEAAFRVLQAIYHGAYDIGLLRRAHATVPTISIGNLAVGGAGKTPVTRWLVDELLRRGETPAVLHGGYAADEPALHALWHPDVAVYAERDRRLSALQAVVGGATVLVLDDGFQHRRLARDLDIVLVAAERWRDHPRLLPRGPWREPPRALARADVVAVTRKTASSERAAEVARALARWAPGAIGICLALVPAGWRRWPALAAKSAGEAPPAPPPAPVVCGVSDPDLFLENATAAGARFESVLLFPDHHAYELDDLIRIRHAARAAGRNVITTAKDAVKLAMAAPELTLWVLDQELRLEQGAPELAAAVDRLLARHPSPTGQAPSGLPAIG